MTSRFSCRLAHVLTFALIVLGASVAQAASEKAVEKAIVPAAQPDPTKIPSLAKMLKSGVKAYYLGRRASTDGWFLLKDSEMQIVYVPVGGTDAILGAMFDSDGDNVTARQVETLMKSNPDIIKELKPDSAVTPNAAPTAGANAASAASMVSPGETLLKQLSEASGVVVGDAAAPLVLMVMDTNCSHCQATWKVLRDEVMSKKLQLRLVPIAASGGDAERSAAMLLSVPDPLTAWDKYVAGDKSTLVGKPDDAAVAKIRANRALIDSWSIDVTPYLVYRSKGQQVKIIRGEVRKADILLEDLNP